jgi:rhomboid family GlyGly-CTERM serine protease
VCPSITQWLAFDTEASHSGEIWRIFTGHFCHYNLSHFVGDVAAFLIWAIVVELISRRLLLGAILGTSALVGCWLLACGAPPMDYRGLSAIDCALAAQLFTLTYFDRRVTARPWLLTALVIATTLFFGKSLYEFSTGHALLAPKLGEGVRLLPETHVLGILAGVSTALVHAVTRRQLIQRNPDNAICLDDATNRIRCVSSS